MSLQSQETALKELYRRLKQKIREFIHDSLGW